MPVDAHQHHQILIHTKMSCLKLMKYLNHRFHQRHYHYYQLQYHHNIHYQELLNLHQNLIYYHHRLELIHQLS